MSAVLPAFVYYYCTCYAVVPVYYGHLGINHKWPDYQGVLIFHDNFYDKDHLES